MTSDSLGTPASGDAAVLAALAHHLGTPLAPRAFTLPGGLRVGVDGADGRDGAPPTLLVQCAASAGPIKSAQRNKVIADAFKLAWLRTHVPRARTLIAVNAPFERLFVTGAWLPAALLEQGVDVLLVAGSGSSVTVRPLVARS